MTTTQNPNSVHTDRARELAHAKLTSEGWAWVEELAQYIHTDGRRARLTFVPDFNAPLEAGRPVWVREVGMQAPGRRPTSVEDVFSRIPTVSIPVPVITFW